MPAEYRLQKVRILQCTFNYDGDCALASDKKQSHSDRTSARYLDGLEG